MFRGRETGRISADSTHTRACFFCVTNEDVLDKKGATASLDSFSHARNLKLQHNQATTQEQGAVGCRVSGDAARGKPQKLLPLCRELQRVRVPRRSCIGNFRLHNRRLVSRHCH